MEARKRLKEFEASLESIVPFGADLEEDPVELNDFVALWFCDLDVSKVYCYRAKNEQERKEFSKGIRGFINNEAVSRAKYYAIPREMNSISYGFTCRQVHSSEGCLVRLLKHYEEKHQKNNYQKESCRISKE